MNRIKRIWIKLRLAMLGVAEQESATAIDIIIAVDEFDAEAQPPAAMPLAA